VVDGGDVSGKVSSSTTGDLELAIKMNKESVPVPLRSMCLELRTHPRPREEVGAPDPPRAILSDNSMFSRCKGKSNRGSE
jgi:hypothetical protein